MIWQYLLIQEAIASTALENDLTEEEINLVYENIMKKLRGEDND